jgi:hypothetical protein
MLRKIRRKKLPKGKFKYVLHLKTGKSRKLSRGNIKEAELIIELLNRSGAGLYYIESDTCNHFNARKNTGSVQRIHRIYLTELTDAMVSKLCYSNFIDEIFEIVVD